jgi:uncharacterized protein (TIGR00645 family)
MTDAPRRSPPIERVLEAGLFGARWLMAPFYVGLALSLAVLAVIFAREFAVEVPKLIIEGGGAEDAILLVLTLIDMSLAGNLLLIVIFSGYENFVSKMDEAVHPDRPAWMGTVDFSGLKMKLIASIVAISAISLLKAFMQLPARPAEIETLQWQVVVHLTFVSSGVLLALMDWLTSKSSTH